MRSYRCYFFDLSNNIRAAEEFSCVDDAEAQRVALDLLRERNHFAAVELWERARRVSRHARESSAA